MSFKDTKLGVLEVLHGKLEIAMRVCPKHAIGQVLVRSDKKRMVVIGLAGVAVGPVL